MAAGRRYWFRAALLAVGLGGAGYLLGNAWLPCSFAWLTGLPCPACGSGRAVRAFLHGDLVAVGHANPLGIPAASLILWAAAAAVLRTFREGSPSRLGTGPEGRWLGRVAAFVAIAEVVLWLVRFTGMLGGPVPV